MRAGSLPANPEEVCSACGHPNEGAEHRCERCGRRLDAPLQSGEEQVRTGNIRVMGLRPPERGAPTRSPGGARAEVRRRGPAFPEPLRRQLSAQVREFRSRRTGPTLPFAAAEAGTPVPIAGTNPSPARNGPAAARSVEARRPRSRAELQTPMEFPGAPSGPSPSTAFAALPVAPLRLRVLGCFLDLAWIMAASLAFVVPFKLLVAEVVYSRLLLAAGLGIASGLALLYGVIFLYLAGATPAMRCLGLRLVNFDGAPASRPERLWRLCGAVVSAGSFLLGFAWAAVDEERFSWHDRISKTFLTTVNR